ncbi:MAG: ABC transporter permease [Kutzneria sp.]|nr:ABC transporter permease [Kutzneria sp.]MBV9844941.1 ABC transporter permease [Kutzneria sp.]
MLRYTLRRLGQMTLVLLALSLLIFVWLHALPGGPVSALLGERATPEAARTLTSQLGLDQPLYVQYVRFLLSALSGNFGASIGVQPGIPVTQVFLERFPATVELTVCAITLAVAVGIPLGYVAARRRGGLLDTLSIIGSLISVAIPVFFLAFLLKYVFAVKLGVLPNSGRQDAIDATRVTGFFVLDGILTQEWDAVLNSLEHLVLPAIALAAVPFSVIFRITRAAVLDVQDENYVRTAESKGLTGAVISRRHVLRNAMLPVATTIGLQAGALLAGAVLTERVFNFPGIGDALALGFQQRDYPLLELLILVAAVVYMAINLVVDLSYGMIDPRVRAG